MSQVEKSNEWQATEPGVRRRVVLDGEKMMLVEVHFEPGAVGNVHKHLHEQATRVISGRIRFILDGLERIVAAGEYLLIPSQTLHGAEALEESLLLDIFSPPRQDFRDY